MTPAEMLHAAFQEWCDAERDVATNVRDLEFDLDKIQRTKEALARNTAHADRAMLLFRDALSLYTERTAPLPESPMTRRLLSALTVMPPKPGEDPDAWARRVLL